MGAVATPELVRTQSTQTRLGIESALIAAFVALCFAVMRVLRPTPEFPLDDSFITLHSAQALHWGFDPNFPGVHPLYGVTSAPFMGLVYLLLFFLRPLSALDVACWLGVLAYLLGLRFMAHSLNLRRSITFSVIAIGALCSFVPLQLLNGLETGWALAAITWTLALASGSEDKWPWAALAAGLAGSIRPDTLSFAFLVILVLITRCCRQRRYSRAILLCAVAVVPIVLTALWYYRAIGSPFPQTGLAKHYFFADAKFSLKYALTLDALTWFGFIISVGPLFFALSYLVRDALGRACLLFFGMFITANFLDWPGAIGTSAFRYPIIFVPILLWAIASRNRSKPGRVLVLSLAYSLVFAGFAIRFYVANCRIVQNFDAEAATWCEQNLPANATLLIHDAGYISYRTRFRLVDFVGLKTPQAIQLNRMFTYPSSGRLRSKAVSQLAEETGSHYLIVAVSPNFSPALVTDLVNLGWNAKLLHQNGAYSVFLITRVSS